MLLPPPYHIAESKLTKYLLVLLPEKDKSNYLKLAGYTLSNWSILAQDLLEVVRTGDASFEENSIFGDSFSILGHLTGPNGRTLAVKTIWMKEEKTGMTKFITLYPP